MYHEKASLSPEVEQLTREVVASAVSPYDKAIALQNWFRENFVYDQTVNYSDAADPVQQFIDDRAGFCQQFSSTFALMTRSLGMASRVAVGFTPGDVVDLKQEGSLVGSDQGGDQPVPGYLVRGRHAHAWPEIYFDGVGWIPFEPTPGRGNPQAVDYSGCRARPGPRPPEQAATTTLPTVTTTPESEQPGAQNDNVNVTDQPTPEAAAGEQGSNSVLRWLLWLIAAVAIVAAVVIIGRTIVHAQRRSHARHDPHGGRVASAWEETLSWLALLGIRPRTSETPVEFTARARPIVGIAALDALADAETTRRFGPADPTQQQCHAAETAAYRCGSGCERPRPGCSGHGEPCADVRADGRDRPPRSNRHGVVRLLVLVVAAKALAGPLARPVEVGPDSAPAESLGGFVDACPAEPTCVALDEQGRGEHAEEADEEGQEIAHAEQHDGRAPARR